MIPTKKDVTDVDSQHVANLRRQDIYKNVAPMLEKVHEFFDSNWQSIYKLGESPGMRFIYEGDLFLSPPAKAEVIRLIKQDSPDMNVTIEDKGECWHTCNTYEFTFKILR